MWGRTGAEGSLTAFRDVGDSEPPPLDSLLVVFGGDLGSNPGHGTWSWLLHLFKPSPLPTQEPAIRFRAQPLPAAVCGTWCLSFPVCKMGETGAPPSLWGLLEG